MGHMAALEPVIPAETFTFTDDMTTLQIEETF